MTDEVHRSFVSRVSQDLQSFHPSSLKGRFILDIEIPKLCLHRHMRQFEQTFYPANKIAIKHILVVPTILTVQNDRRKDHRMCLAIAACSILKSYGCGCSCFTSRDQEEFFFHRRKLGTVPFIDFDEHALEDSVNAAKMCQFHMNARVVRNALMRTLGSGVCLGSPVGLGRYVVFMVYWQGKNAVNFS